MPIAREVKGDGVVRQDSPETLDARKSFEFAIIASGIDPEAAYEDALFESGCDDATLSVQKGVLIAEFDREAVSFSRAVASACQNVAAAGFKVERVEPDHLVSLAEIAERSNLSRQAISLYAKGDRGLGFPPPSAKITSKHPLWDWHEVAEWLCRKNYLPVEEVVRAKIVKEVNIYLASAGLSHDGFLGRLEACEAA